MVASLGVIWGGTFMVVTVALQGYGPVTVTAARTGLGAVTLLGLALALRRPWPRFEGRFLAFVLPIGILSSALPFFLLAWGQQHVSSAYAGLNMAALPLFVLPLAHVFGDERLSFRKSTGFLIGFAGAAVLIAPGITSGSGSAAEPMARLACLGAVISYAISSILTRRCPPVDPVVLSALGLTIGGAILIPAMLLIEGPPGWSGAQAGWAILFLGLVPTGLAALLRVLVIRSAGSTFMTLVNYQVPVWSMVFGALVLSEALPWRFFVALALILLGLAVSQFGALRRLFAR